VFFRRLPTTGIFNPNRGLVFLFLLLLLNSGCSQDVLQLERLPNLLPNTSTNASFQLRVAPSPKDGVYRVTGTTNLPDESPIAIAAVRYLHPDPSLPANEDSKPTYSILAYQDVEVKGGEWQANLNLWEVASDGKYQEVWQIEQSELGLTLDPDKEVLFLATLAPTDALWTIQQQLENQGIKVDKSLIRNTLDGERYVQATQIMPIPLPTASTEPPVERPQDVNGGWGPRYILLPEPPNKRKLDVLDERRTDAPLAPGEFMH